MTDVDLFLADKLLSHQIALLRYSASEKDRVLKLFTQMEKELKAKLASDDITEFSKQRLEKLLEECAAVIKETYKDIRVNFGATARKMTRAEFERQAEFIHGTNEAGAAAIRRGEYDMAKRVFTFEPEGMFVVTRDNEALARFYAKQRAEQFGGKPVLVRGDIRQGAKVKFRDKANIIVDPRDFITYEKAIEEDNLFEIARHETQAVQKTMASIGLEASIPTAVTVKALIADTLLQGAPLADWWAKQAEDTAFKFMAQVRQGVAQGETLQQIITRIVGSPKKGIPGIMDISRRNALTLVHDSVMQITNDARMAVYRENDDIIKGVRWLATLDGHTCLRCIPRDGKMWTLDGKPLNTNLTFSMPPAHPACRCVLCPVTKTMKELGIDVEELPKGTRASDLGQIPADTSFDAFLARHSDEYLNKLLGPGRAELYRKGKITLNQLIDQTGRPLRLEELEKLAA